MKPPRYLGKLDRDEFLRELAAWAVDNGGKQLARDIGHLAADFAQQVDELKQDIRDLLKARDDEE
jgi:hypothetical protein